MCAARGKGSGEGGVRDRMGSVGGGEGGQPTGDVHGKYAMSQSVGLMLMERVPAF